MTKTKTTIPQHWLAPYRAAVAALDGAGQGGPAPLYADGSRDAVTRPRGLPEVIETELGPVPEGWGLYWPPAEPRQALTLAEVWRGVPESLATALQSAARIPTYGGAWGEWVREYLTAPLAAAATDVAERSARLAALPEEIAEAEAERVRWVERLRTEREIVGAWDPDGDDEPPSSVPILAAEARAKGARDRGKALRAERDRLNGETFGSLAEAESRLERLTRSLVEPETWKAHRAEHDRREREREAQQREAWLAVARAVAAREERERQVEEAEHRAAAHAALDTFARAAVEHARA
jgi:hypothetical protein